MEKQRQTSSRDLVLTPPAKNEVCMGVTRCRLLAGDASGLPGGNASGVPVSLNCRVVSACLTKHELLPSFKMRDLDIVRHGFPSVTAINFALLREDRGLG